MTITRFEKVNEEKLIEVLQCSNISETEDADDNKNFSFTANNIIYKYYQIPLIDNQREIRYLRNNDFGRYYCTGGVGLQMMNTEVRKYICENRYKDVDIVKCHIVILEQLFIKYKIDTPTFLTDYLLDAEKMINKFNLINKKGVFKKINNSNAKFEKDTSLKVFHKSIYEELVPKLKLEYKEIWNFYKKETKNREGSFLSVVLMTIENDILQSIIDLLGDKVCVLCFDGFLIEKEHFSKKLIEKLEHHIFETCNFKVELVEKTTKTDWKPIIKSDFKNSIWSKYNLDNVNDNSFLKRKCMLLYGMCFTDKGKIIEKNVKHLIDYLNNFACVFEYPKGYGWRYDKTKLFQHTGNTYNWLSSQAGVGPIKLWNSRDERLKYIRPVFYINASEKLSPEYYNTYIRPKMTKSDTFDYKSSILHHYLLNVICNGDNKIYDWLLLYISHIFRYGRSDILIALMGKKGCGKSIFVEEFLTKLLQDIFNSFDDDYVNVIDGIDGLMSNFNSFMEKSIIVCCEEVVSGAGEYHKINEKLKSLTTSKKRQIEKKGIDRYNVESVNNFILISNNENPVKITEGNRRNVVLEVSELKKRDHIYFGELVDYINENIEYIRYYFFNLTKKPVKLQSIRPTTQKELELLELNKHNVLRFCEEEIEDILKECNDFNHVYDMYKRYCINIGEKSISRNYFISKTDGLYFTAKPYCKTLKKRSSYNIVFKSGEEIRCNCSKCARM